jgi:hypothetical protein
LGNKVKNDPSAINNNAIANRASTSENPLVREHALALTMVTLQR